MGMTFVELNHSFSDTVIDFGVGDVISHGAGFFQVTSASLLSVDLLQDTDCKSEVNSEN